MRGVTLIELLLVVSIVAIVSLSATPFYARFLRQNAVADATDRIVGNLRKAQMYSMAGKQDGTWGVTYSSNTLTLFLQGNSAFDETYTVGSDITVSGLSTVLFTKATGIPTSTPTITITGGNTTKTILINSQGVIDRQ